MRGLQLSRTHLLFTAALCVVGAFAQQECSQHATAAAGDSCASLAKAHGIDQEQFIKLNPGLRSCALAAGTAYCVGTGTPKAPPAGNGTITLVPSPDGSDGICGGNYTCLGSAYGDCCSLNGYCGNATDYCLVDNCDPRFGRCGGIDASCQADTTTVTTTVVSVSTTTATITATATATVTNIQTVTSVQTAKPTTTSPGSTAPSPTLPGVVAGCKRS